MENLEAEEAMPYLANLGQLVAGAAKAYDTRFESNLNNSLNKAGCACTDFDTTLATKSPKKCQPVEFVKHAAQKSPTSLQTPWTTAVLG